VATKSTRARLSASMKFAAASKAFILLADSDSDGQFRLIPIRRKKTFLEASSRILEARRLFKRETRAPAFHGAPFES
jgi:hypothetical protein